MTIARCPGSRAAADRYYWISISPQRELPSATGLSPAMQAMRAPGFLATAMNCSVGWLTQEAGLLAVA
jgi:hypothetical protein